MVEHGAGLGMKDYTYRLGETTRWHGSSAGCDDLLCLESEQRLQHKECDTCECDRGAVVRRLNN